MKVCFRCRVRKVNSEFQASRHKLRGQVGVCKCCKLTAARHDRNGVTESHKLMRAWHPYPPKHKETRT